MTTDVGIVNLALSHLGDSATVTSIDPPEGSVQASKAATFYPIARDALLEMHDWDFAITRVDAALLSSITLPDSWSYAYAVPNDCLAILQVLLPETSNDIGFSPPAVSLFSAQPYAREVDLLTDTNVIFTNAETAVLRYKIRVEDATRFSASFVIALSYLLASYLAGPIYKGKAGQQMATAMLQLFAATLPAATRLDAGQGYQPTGHMPPHLAVR